MAVSRRRTARAVALAFHVFLARCLLLQRCAERPREAARRDAEDVSHYRGRRRGGPHDCASATRAREGANAGADAEQGHGRAATGWPRGGDHGVDGAAGWRRGEDQ
jgi:hypothetical protein